MTEQQVARAALDSGGKIEDPASGPGRQADTFVHTGNPELEALATGVELTLVSVLQGIALAILIPKIVDLIASGQVAKLPYVPASLLLVFIVWVTFISHALSFVSWPFDPIHNLFYFLVVTSEVVILIFLDQPAQWALALAGFAAVMMLSYWYNQRQLRRNERLYNTRGAARLYNHIAYDHIISMRFMAGYITAGLLGFALLRLRPELGLPQELGWLVTGTAAVILPAIHMVWQTRLMVQRMRAIEAVRDDPTPL
jgi:hypothetical protein